ncbi:hypothetical protein SOM11_12185 [Frigoribacterium sp. CFBP9039]|uniref:hypothetical protein n=1 Tax=Frigoribacterium sp. CFBP9029 TaxID=3096541 RepID=UPI002A6B2C42|nr:hypothetical protein [Frigoribacterium sp. CFBP9039]MDY0946745.1 hypothetical protein [Frigoribacterium sp. CFBP9039]
MAISVALRVGGFAIITVLALRHSSPAHSETEQTSKSWVYVFGASLALYFVVGAAFHAQITTFILYMIGLVLLVVAATASVSATDQDLRKGVVWALGALLVSSLALGALVPALGFEGGRLRGVLENANTLGFFAFLLGCAALTIVDSPRWRVALLLLSGIILVLSASRASSLALAIVVLLLVLRRGFARSIIIAVSGVLVLGVVLLLNPSLLDPFANLLRMNDSRSDSTATALRAFETSPLIGIGVGNESSIIASSPFRALAQAGIFGLVAVISMWIILLIQGLKSGYKTVTVAIAAIVHSVFEGWLLSPVSPLLAIFMFFWIVVANREKSDSTGRKTRTNQTNIDYQIKLRQ